jgi:hypothetical protein
MCKNSIWTRIDGYVYTCYNYITGRTSYRHQAGSDKRKKGAVPMPKSFTITFKHSGISYQVFKDEFVPNWQDVHSALRHMNQQGTLDLCVPAWCESGAFILECNEAQAAKFVPEIITLANDRVRKGIIDMDESILAPIWVLSWYNYHKLQGPKPQSLDTVRKTVSKPISYAELRCPLCGRAHKAPKRYKSTQAIFKHYVKVWLPRHAKEYHKFDW